MHTRSLKWGLPARTIQLLPILLLAFALRVHHLDFQSLWSDEGISLLRSSQPLGQMLRNMPVEHMPGYFVFLHFWLPLAGISDFALRYLSLLPSILALAVVYRLAADLGSPRTGLIAAVLLATNSFQIWYAQEARMYSWLLAAGITATWLLWRLLNTKTPRIALRIDSPDGDLPAAPVRRTGRAFRVKLPAWTVAFVGYVVSMASVIYLHAYGFLLPVAHSLFALVWLAYTRNLRAFLRWVAAGCVVILLFLPWLPRFLGMFGFPGYGQDLNPLQLPWQYLTAYTVGDPMPAPWYGWLPVVYLVLALAGAWAWWRRNRLAGWLLVLATAVPLAGAFAIALRKAGYHERYTIFLSAPLFLLAAGGFAGFDLRAWQASRAQPPHGPWLAANSLLAAALLAGLLGANVLAADRLYTDSGVQKADYRSLAHRIEQLESSGDVVLTVGLTPQQVFTHYYQGRLAVHDLSSVADASDAEVDAVLRAATAGSQRAWLLRYHHSEGPREYWLASHGWLANRTDYSVDGLTLSIYGLPALSQVNLPAEISFGPGLKLTGMTVAGGGAQEGTPTFRAGDLLGITTVWEVLGDLPPLKFSLRLLDANGRTWLTEDYVPLDGFAPTERWKPGTPAADRHGFLLPADLPPGRYDISLLLYDPSTGAPVGATTSNGTPLAAINLLPAAVPPDSDELPIPVRLNERLAGQLDLLGFELAPQPLREGQGGELTLWWRAAGHPDQPYQLRLEATDSHGQVAIRQSYPLSSAPADTWQPGQVVRERYTFELDPPVTPGAYDFKLSLLGSAGEPIGSSLSLGSVALEARPRIYRLPRVSRPLDMRLADSIHLRGYDLAMPAAAGGNIRLTLYWQAMQPILARYKVFVHLVDDSGRIVAQADAIPAEGEAPTEGWQAGEVVVDKHVLPVPGAGHYRLLVGLYDPASGQRPPVYDAAQRPIVDSAIPLTDVELF